MPRVARQQAQSGIYHIMLRFINRQDIFTDDADRRRFLQLLADLQHDYLFSMLITALLLGFTAETFSEPYWWVPFFYSIVTQFDYQKIKL